MTVPTNEMASELICDEIKNAGMVKVTFLIGPGRWGSSDPWLGIHMQWPHISEAKVMWGCGMKNFQIEPSQRTISSESDIIWYWLSLINLLKRRALWTLKDSTPWNHFLAGSKYLRAVRFEKPLYIFMGGRKSKVWIRN